MAHKRLSKEERERQNQRLRDQSLDKNRFTSENERQASRGFEDFRAKRQRYGGALRDQITIDIETTGLGRMVYNPSELAWRSETSELINSMDKMTRGEQIATARKLQFYKYFEEVGLAQLVAQGGPFKKHGVAARALHHRTNIHPTGPHRTDPGPHGYVTFADNHADSAIKAMERLSSLIASQFAYKTGIVSRSMQAHKAGTAITEAEAIIGFMKGLTEADTAGQRAIKLSGHNVFYDIMGIQAFAIKHAEKLLEAGLDPFLLINKYWNGDLQVNAVEDSFFDVLRAKGLHQPAWARRYLVFGRASQGMFPDAPEIVPGMKMSKDVLLRDVERVKAGKQSFLRARPGWSLSIIFETFFRYSHLTEEELGIPYSMWRKLDAHDALWDTAFASAARDRFETLNTNLEYFGSLLNRKINPPEKWGSHPFSYQDVEAIAFARSGFAGRGLARPDIQSHEEYLQWIMSNKKVLAMAKRRTKTIWKTWQWRTEGKVRFAGSPDERLNSNKAGPPPPRPPSSKTFVPPIVNQMGLADDGTDNLANLIIKGHNFVHKKAFQMGQLWGKFLQMPAWKKAGLVVGASYGLYKAFDWAVLDRQNTSQLRSNLPPDYVKGMQGSSYAVKVPWASPFQGTEQDEQTISLVKDGAPLLKMMAVYGAAGIVPRTISWLGGTTGSKKLYEATRNIEDMLPFRIGRIFGKSSKFSSFLTTKITVPTDQLYGRGTMGLTALGKAYANALGMDDDKFLNIIRNTGELILERSPFSAYHKLIVDGIEYKVRMFQAGSRFGGVFATHGAYPSFVRQRPKFHQLVTQSLYDINPINRLYKREGIKTQLWVPGYTSTGTMFKSIFRNPVEGFKQLRRRIGGTVFGWHSTIWREARTMFHQRLSLAERGINRLLSSDFSKKVAKHLGVRIPFVKLPKPSLSSETSTFGMYKKFAKLGIGLYAAWKGFDIVNQSMGGALSAPLWNARDRFKLMRARISDALGFTDIRKQHPEVSSLAGVAWAATPLVAFGLMAYGRRAAITPRFTRKQIESFDRNGNLDIDVKNKRVRKGSLFGERAVSRAFGKHTPVRRARLNWVKTLTTKMTDKEVQQAMTQPIRGFSARMQLRAGMDRPRKLNWKGKGLLGYVVGAMALLAPFTLGSKESYTETRDILAGRQKVEIRKGRWWEMGCLTENCQVMTEIGKSKSVKDIQTGENVINANGLLEEVTQVWVKPFSGKVYKLQTYINQVDETILTGNHIVPAIKLYTSKTFAHKNNLFIIKEFRADNLNENCYVEVPKPKLPDEKIKQINVKNFLYKYIEKDNRIYPAQINHYTQKLVIAGGSTYYLSPVIEIDQDISWLMGMFLAEGNLSFNNGNPTIVETVHHKNELEFANKIQKIVLDKFGIKINIYQNNKSDNYIRLRICHSLLAQLFYRLFYKERTKNIPELIKYFSEENILAFIQGWFDGDGYKTKPESAIKTSRLDYAKWLYDILLSLGYLPSINKSKSPKNGKVFTGYRVYWTNAKNIDRKGWLIVDDKLFAKIHSIEIEDYEGNVYDLGLDNDPHLFVAGGFLVHNSTPWQGKNTSYFRYDQSVRRRIEAEQEMPGEGRGIISTIKDVLNPYWREKESYWNRPYPVSAPPFQDVPIIGPLLSSTIGRILKPPAYMHREEFDPGLGYIPYNIDTEPSVELGGLKGAPPHTQAGYRSLIRDTAYRTTEFIGLRGYLTQEWLFKPLTGGQAPYAEAPYLQAPRFNSFTDRWYRSELGGMLGQNEIWRRFFPRPEPGVEVNNIPNRMPTWIPGEDYFINFKQGDPYSKIPYGTERLPGPGFEAIHPELKDVPYENYPSWAKYEILCLHPDTLIPTNNGIKPIKEININTDLVINECGNFQKIKAKLHRKESDITTKIFTFYNSEPLICSDKHKILTINKEKIITEKHAIEITKEDYLLYPIMQFENKKHLCIGDFCDTKDVWLKYKNADYYAHIKGSQSLIKFNLLADKNLGRIFGLYLAEGYLKPERGSITWCFNLKTEKDTLGAEIKNFANLINCNFSEREESKTNSYQITISNKLLANLFISLFGYSSKNKDIKFNPFQFSKEFVLGIIEGYFDGDGCIIEYNNQTMCRATSISKKLILSIRSLIFGIGAIGSFSTRKGKYLTNNNNIAYICNIQRRDLDKFDFKTLKLDDVNKYNVSDSEKLNFQTEQFIAIRVKNVIIDKINNLEWYDLSLDGNIHRFLTINGIVHNSDVAPWSKQTKIWEAVARREAQQTQDPTLAFHLDRVAKEKSLVMNRRLFQPLSFTEDSDYISGEVTEITPGGAFKLAQYPNHTFTMKGVGFGASEASTYLRDHNTMTKERADRAALRMQQERSEKIGDAFIGRNVDLRIRKSGLNNPDVSAEVFIGGDPVGEYLEDKGMGVPQFEGRVNAGFLERIYGAAVERLGHLPQKIPGPFFLQAKAHNQVTPIEAYRRDQIYSKEFRPWSQPYQSFIRPYLQGALAKITPGDFIPEHIQERRDMDRLYDRLAYLKAAEAGDSRGMNRTMVGADVMGEHIHLRSALPRREREYFDAFRQETDSEARETILGMVSEDMGRALVGQWTKQYNQTVGGGIMPPPDKQAMMAINTQIAQEDIENLGYNVPDSTWVGWNQAVNMEDVKAVHLQNEGMNVHDFNIWEDRLYNLNRKPYLRGSHEFLTSAPLVSGPDILSHTGSYYTQDTMFFNETARFSPVSSVTINHTQDHRAYEEAQYYKARRSLME